jgi:aconitate hydratase
LTPHLNGPFTPDWQLQFLNSELKLKPTDGHLEVEWALIGSCTNSSYEDLSRAASIVEDAVAKGVKPKAILGINPGSEQVNLQQKETVFDSFRKFENARIFTNACGPCIGQWDREGAEKGEKTLLFTLSTETLQKEQTETQIPTLS